MSAATRRFLKFFPASSRLTLVCSMLIAPCLLAGTATNSALLPSSSGERTIFSTSAYTSGYGAPHSTRDTFSLQRLDADHVSFALDAKAPETVTPDSNGIIPVSNIQTARTLSRYNDLAAIMAAAGPHRPISGSWTATIPLAAGVDEIVPTKVRVTASTGPAEALTLRAEGMVQTPISGPVGKVLIKIHTQQSYRFLADSFIAGDGVDTSTATVFFKHIKVATQWKLIAIATAKKTL